MRHVATFAIRRIMWRIDPLLIMHILSSHVVISAGKWVDRRLDLRRAKKVIHRSQLGVGGEVFQLTVNSNVTNSSEKVELICAGRLDWIKGVDLAIESLALLPSEYCLRIVGKGQAEQSLRALVIKLKLENRVIFQPPVSRDSLSELYASASLFLFTSAEVAGLVWIEALASGLPVVAFDGTTEVAAAAHYLPGIQLAKNADDRDVNIKSLATAIKASLNLPRNSEVLRASVLKRYSWGSLAVTIEKAYDEVLELPR
jgi:glycosyltransferase involved in cell wall biosynthesis